MEDVVKQQYPQVYVEIDRSTKESGFTMASDALTCSLLRTLAASKPSGKFLELGTGTGLSTSWILNGMDDKSTLTSIDNAEEFLGIAKTFLGKDNRLSLVLTDGADWVNQNKNQKYDYI